MEIVKPKRISSEDGKQFFTIRVVHTEDMQEFLCPDGEDIYNSQEERNRKKKELGEKTFNYRLAADSEEQLRYNALIESIVEYKDHDEYKRKTSFIYKVMKFLKLTT